MHGISELRRRKRFSLHVSVSIACAIRGDSSLTKYSRYKAWIAVHSVQHCDHLAAQHTDHWRFRNGPHVRYSGAG